MHNLRLLLSRGQTCHFVLGQVRDTSVITGLAKSKKGISVGRWITRGSFELFFHSFSFWGLPSSYKYDISRRESHSLTIFSERKFSFLSRSARLGGNSRICGL